MCSYVWPISHALLSSLAWMSSSLVMDEISQLWMRPSLMWMRSRLLVRASVCRSRNSPVFDPSILRHSAIWGAADESVLNTVHRKKSKKIPLSIILAPSQHTFSQALKRDASKIAMPPSLLAPPSPSTILTLQDAGVPHRHWEDVMQEAERRLGQQLLRQRRFLHELAERLLGPLNHLRADRPRHGRRHRRRNAGQ